MTELVDRQYDVEQPFLAIVPDAIAGGSFDRTHQVYLVNPLDRPLNDLYERIGGFFSDDDGVMCAQPKERGPHEVPPHSALALEATSEDEFAELVCWWSIRYEVDRETCTRTFDAGKGLRHTERREVCPVLERPALVVSGSPIDRKRRTNPNVEPKRFWLKSEEDVDAVATELWEEMRRAKTQKGDAKP